MRMLTFSTHCIGLAGFQVARSPVQTLAFFDSLSACWISQKYFIRWRFS
jgi:hypothetical protein